MEHRFVPAHSSSPAGDGVAEKPPPEAVSPPAAAQPSAAERSAAESWLNQAQRNLRVGAY